MTVVYFVIEQITYALHLVTGPTRPSTWQKCGEAAQKASFNENHGLKCEHFGRLGAALARVRFDFMAVQFYFQSTGNKTYHVRCLKPRIGLVM